MIPRYTKCNWHSSKLSLIVIVSSAGTAGIVLAVLSVPMDGAHMSQLGPGGVFGWLRRDYLLRGTYLSVGPGLFGHVGFNVGSRFLCTSFSEIAACCASKRCPPIAVLLIAMACAAGESMIHVRWAAERPAW